MAHEIMADSTLRSSCMKGLGCEGAYGPSSDSISRVRRKLIETLRVHATSEAKVGHVDTELSVDLFAA
eukprot:4810128-Amphidinium_carterae.1